ncbi:MAG: hypothetical protein V9G12_19630 [Microthrixaceae bacterium]
MVEQPALGGHRGQHQLLRRCSQVDALDLLEIAPLEPGFGGQVVEASLDALGIGHCCCGPLLEPRRHLGEQRGVEERSQQLLPLVRLGLEDALELALRQQDHLVELRDVQTDDVLDLGADVGLLGGDARPTVVGQTFEAYPARFRCRASASLGCDVRRRA